MTDDDLRRRRIRRVFEMKARRFAADHELLPEGSRVLVAVSGGQDSTALLLALEQLSHRGGFGLAVAHFDHGLRGRAAAEREGRFVRELALSLGLPFYTSGADVRALAAERKQSIEAAARQARYEFLTTAAQEAECKLVATGHTASDQAETVLMNLIRGAGLDGMGGMKPEAPLPFSGRAWVRLVRPLLRVTRGETAAYCAARGVEPVQDESNESPEFERNRVRRELVPLLKTFNPRVEDAIVRLADSARLDVDYLERRSIEGIAAQSSGKSIRYTWKRIVARDDALRRHGLRVAVQLLLGDREGFSERHYLAMERMIWEGQTGDRLNLPRGVVADRGRDWIKLSLGDPGAPQLPDGDVELPVPGEVPFGRLVCAATAPMTGGAPLNGAGRRVSAHPSVDVDAESVGPSLRVRRRRNGDRFQPLGMLGTKKLQDFFVDERVPSDRRDSVPIFENQYGIVWVGGMRIAEWARPRPGRPTVRLSFVQANSRRT